MFPVIDPELRKLPITVMLGGTSAEREVSLRSGAAVARVLRELGYRVTELDPCELDWALPAEPGLVFLALHGGQGEDGTVQARLEELGVPYTGCDSASSRVAFDKAATKRCCEQAGVPTPSWVVIGDPAADWPRDWEPPVVIKPVRQGSSVGLGVVKERSAWQSALAEALRHDREALVEAWIPGRELTAGILAGEALPLVEVRPRTGNYDYRNKYTAGATLYECPAGLGAEATRRVHAAALGAFRAVGGRDYARVDVMLDGESRPWVLEVNTLPGMTETSLFPKAAAAAGLDFGTLCELMVQLTLRRAGLA